MSPPVAMRIGDHRYGGCPPTVLQRHSMNLDAGHGTDRHSSKIDP
jgi:hypothetical protein